MYYIRTGMHPQAGISENTAKNKKAAQNCLHGFLYALEKTRYSCFSMAMHWNTPLFTTVPSVTV